MVRKMTITGYKKCTSEPTKEECKPFTITPKAVDFLLVWNLKICQVLFGSKSKQKTKNLYSTRFYEIVFQDWYKPRINLVIQLGTSL